MPSVDVDAYVTAWSFQLRDDGPWVTVRFQLQLPAKSVCFSSADVAPKPPYGEWPLPKTHPLVMDVLFSILHYILGPDFTVYRFSVSHYVTLIFWMKLLLA